MSIRTALRAIVGNDSHLLHVGVLELLDVRRLPLAEPAGAAGRRHALSESGPHPVDVLLALHHDDRPPVRPRIGLAQGLQAIQPRLYARHVEGPTAAAVASALPEVLQTDADHLVGFVVAITNDLVRLQLGHGNLDRAGDLLGRAPDAALQAPAHLVLVPDEQGGFLVVVGRTPRRPAAPRLLDTLQAAE